MLIYAQSGVDSSLNDLSRAILEGETSGYYQFKTEMLRRSQEKGLEQERKEGHKEGWIHGMAEAELEVLSARGIDVPARTAEQVRTASEAQLTWWLQRAVTARSIDDLCVAGQAPSQD